MNELLKNSQHKFNWCQLYLVNLLKFFYKKGIEYNKWKVAKVILLDIQKISD